MGKEIETFDEEVWGELNEEGTLLEYENRWNHVPIPVKMNCDSDG